MLFSLQGRRCIFWCAFILSFVVVEIVSSARGGLLLTRYINAGKSCELLNSNGSNSTNSQVVYQPIEADYVFHIIHYAVGFLLRCMEYVLLAQGIYEFTQSYQDVQITLCEIWSKTWKGGICWAIVLIPTLLLPCLATPSLGIASELSYASKLEECAEHDVTIFLVYAALTMLTYFFAYCIRVAMVFATIAVCRLWFPEGYPSGRSRTNTFDSQTKSEQLCQEEQFIKDWSVVSTKHGELAEYRTYKKK